ncbi:shikimate dehydrogenase [Xanthobacter tagetidis]|uniref:Shikimate dehydrogenase (NADP(+)) n=1 Tax=Xanthobacter tagetidis TaxID=60216 RepID=A0A3L7A5Q3_9HYPH|nr:shikimate dehydrogenase [Xanthobacter tagetidis]MBB6308724.1 shikimate dehydrogenase [Xanthobacter tagetidis]RLP75434.1 shikimate dehydrogenase [Xanthobacter tagetidis]
MTTRVCITGQPVSYSRSPLLHGFWLKEHGIDGFYGREEVPPDTAADFYRTLADRGYAGCNVTAPNKEIAFSVLDAADPSAVALGAANTLWLEDGRLCGANTDGYGFLANLDATVPGWEGARRLALVLGAGGASRAVVRGLVERGFDRVLLVNRTLARAEEVAKPFPGTVHPKGWEVVPAALAEADILVNTTSLGMKGAEPMAIDLSPLRDEAVVSDVVYVPLITPLLKLATARGLRTVDGLGMLLHQGVPGFERWFGVRPKVSEALRAFIIEDLRAKGQLEA